MDRLNSLPNCLKLERPHLSRFNNIRRDALDHRGDQVSLLKLVCRDFLNNVADNTDLICFFSCNMFVAYGTTYNALFPHQVFFKLFPDPLCFTQ